MLEILTLGGLSIRLDGEPVDGFASRKAEALLVYVACTGRPKARDILAEMLWEERTQSQALSNLRVVLSSLRKTLGSYVSISRDAVGINLDADVWMDVVHLEQALDEVRGGRLLLSDEAISVLEDASALYQGDFLEGWYVRGSYGFENWAVLERERVRAVFEELIQHLLGLLLAAQRWHQAIEWGERWIGLGQSPEPAFRALMNAYAGLGDLAGVASVYQRCVDALAEDLGVDPSPQTLEAYQRLSSGGSPVPAVEASRSGTQAPHADRAAKTVLGELRARGTEVLDVASLAAVYASRADLGIGPREAGLLIRSALYHGLDVEPWLARAGSPQAATQALGATLERYPRPRIRGQIVKALTSLEAEEATEILLEVAQTDDAPEVRSEAAVAAASRGRLDEVARAQVGALVTGQEAGPLAALVAIADRFGIPEDTGSYPKLPVAIALAQRRWRARRGEILWQTLVAGIGAGIALALHGGAIPLYYALTAPDLLQAGLVDNTLSSWILQGAFGLLFVGCLQGLASGFAVGLADGVWQGGSRQRVRLLLGAVAGLFWSFYLIMFSLTALLEPRAGPAVYMTIYLVYGLTLGMLLSLACPKLSSWPPARKQVLRAVLVAAAVAAITAPCVLLAYGETAASVMAEKIGQVFWLTVGFGLGLSRLGRKRGVLEEPDRPPP